MRIDSRRIATKARLSRGHAPPPGTKELREAQLLTGAPAVWGSTIAGLALLMLCGVASASGQVAADTDAGVVARPSSLDEGDAGPAPAPPSPLPATGARSSPALPANPTQAAPRPATPRPEDSAGVNLDRASRPEEATSLLRTVVGLALLVLLSYLAALPRLRRLEEKLGVTQLITAGFAFVVLGGAARELNVLTPATLVELTPVLHFGLGWLGFVAGFRLDVRVLDDLPAGTGRALALSTCLPLLTISLSCGLGIFALGWLGFEEALVAGLALGMAGAMAAPRLGRFRSSLALAPDLATRIHQLDEVTAVAGLALMACYLRPDQAQLTWTLPGTVWLFITLGMGLCVGLVVYSALGIDGNDAEFLAVSLGSIAFAAGMAGYLHLSPMVVCFVAGCLVVNLPFASRPRLALHLGRLERPILLLFLALTGALWDFRESRGWLLVPLFIASRVGGKLLAVLVLKRTGVGVREAQKEPLMEQRLVFSPLSVMSIAVVLGMQSLYQHESLSWMVTAVIGGALVTELLVHRLPRAAPSTERRSP